MTLKLAVKVTAETDDFKQGMSQAEASLKGVQGAAGRTEAAVRQTTTATKGLEGQSQATGAALNQTAAASRQLDEAAQKTAASVQQCTVSARQLGEQSHSTARNLQAMQDGVGRRLAEGASLSRQQLLALQYTASDVASSLASGASPFTILMQQGGQVLQVFPGIAGTILRIGGAAAVIAAPLGIVMSRMMEIGAQGRELTTVIKGMGDRAGVTAEELRKMVMAATERGASRQDAYDAALGLARNRSIQGTDMFRSILELAPDVAAVLGTTVTDAAKKMGDAFKDGAAGVKRLDEELGFLTVEQAKQVRQFSDQGDRAAALGVAMQALQKRFGGAATTMRTEWGKALHEAGVAWDAFVERLATSDVAQWVARKVGGVAQAVRTQLAQDEAAQLRSEIARLEQEYARLPEKTSGIQATHEASIRRRIELQQRLNALTGQDNKPSVSTAPAPAPTLGPSGGMTDGERKRVDELREALDRERQAIRGTISERQVRLAGLEAERAALDAGRSPAAAMQERLVAEDRARMMLNTAIGDTTAQLSLEALGVLAVADAYLTSSAAGLEAEARFQAMQESLQNDVDVESRAKEILAARTASLAAAGAQSAAQMREEVAIRAKVAQAALQGAAALSKAELAAKVELATLPERLALRHADAETTRVLTAAIQAKTEAILADAEAEKTREVGSSIQQQLDEIQLLEKQLKMRGHGAEAMAVAIERERAIIDLRRMGIDVTGQLTDAERRLADQYMNAVNRRVSLQQEIAYFEEVKRVSEDIASDVSESICEFPDEIADDTEFQAIFAEVTQ